MGPVTTVCLPFAYVGERDLSSHHDPVTIGWGETRADGGANPVLKQVCEPSTGLNEQGDPVEFYSERQLIMQDFWDNTLLLVLKKFLRKFHTCIYK